jgi:hypothetical protein
VEQEKVPSKLTKKKEGKGASEERKSSQFAKGKY